MSNAAQSRAADAVAQQNYQTQLAQNQGFLSRMQATQAQTAAQSQVEQQAIADRSNAALAMRQQQSNAMNQQQQVINAENQQMEAIRQQGDVQGQTLAAATTADQLATAQAQSRAQAAAALASSGVMPQGPGPTDPGGTGDPATNTAVARRLAEAATNIRDYGSKIGAVQAYQAPLTGVNTAIAAAKTGIMPAVTAQQLLASGNQTRLLPSQVAYTNAANTGQATDALLQAREQAGLGIAGLDYGNQSTLANLTQADTTTLAANRAAQEKVNATAQQQIAGIISGIGNLGLYGVGYKFGGPSFLNPYSTGTSPNFPGPSP
jgi:hypothetical protein